MIHVLRWLAIAGTVGFFYWVFQPSFRRFRAPDKRNKREVW